MPNPVVVTENLTKRYGTFAALSNLNLTIERGAIYGFIGPNGAGKTTTMRILATLLEQTEGQAWVADYPVSEAPMEVRKRIGYMPDFFGVYDNMKVWEYLDFFASAYHVPTDKRKGMIGDLLSLVDLSAKEIDALFADGTISGGMLPKISGALDAARAGVNAVHIIDGRVPHAMLLEILTDQAYGTMIRAR